MLAGGLDRGLSQFEVGGGGGRGRGRGRGRFSGVGEAASRGRDDLGGEGEGFVEGMEVKEEVVEGVEADVEALGSSACGGPGVVAFGD